MSDFIEEIMCEPFIEKSVDRLTDAYKFSQQLGLGKLYVAFSGGKDSVALYGVCKKTAEKLGMDVLDMCEFHYNITTVDPPELVRFINEHFPFVIKDRSSKTMVQLIVENRVPPTTLMRYCCKELKERGGNGRFCVTGVRWAESTRRKNTRGAFETFSKEKTERILMNDNEDDRRLMEHCIPKRKYVCNPIIDWDDDTIWAFIHTEGLPYCSLYDEGFKRLGCIGCPMAAKQRVKQFERWPGYKKMYLYAFKKMLEVRKERGLETKWKTPEEVFDWWINRR